MIVFAGRVTAISVIIPTLNEADQIEKTIRSLGSGGVDEIIVVDGGSEDETCAMAARAGAQVLRSSTSGRARQLNLGASEASGDVLLFVHADTQIPEKALQALYSLVEHDSELIGGGFLRRFDSASAFLRFSCWLAGLRSRWKGLFLGDQAIFVKRSVFLELGGMDVSFEVGEDLDFSARMRRLGKTKVIGPPILTSARRFDQLGPMRQTWKDTGAALKILRQSRANQRSRSRP
ncbi:MAG: TIGR04283 family arsenosugar biosynthesis glycosyltransferase [Verrucomicrobiota bacterium]